MQNGVMRPRTRPFRTPANLRTLLGALLVVAILTVADVAATRTTLKFLLLPPFGALTYLVFLNPARLELGVRHIILSPTLTAVWAWLLASIVGDTVISVAAAAAGTMAIMWITRTHLVVPPMALALLTLLLYRDVRWQVDYLISVLIFTIGVYILYRLWIVLPIGSLRTAWPEE